ncbi:MAG: capsule biosynthesis protein CapA [Alphaproteobacteria bacterium]|nr:MAG: capsule biosynthesis protein CapA [Alphaproteobacteria bacterium]
MRRTTGEGRRFLFLQGPHGPFFRQLGDMLRRAGAEVWRVGFNRGDEAFWRPAPGFIPFTGRQEDWPDHIDELLRAHAITDLVLYGDARFIHAEAIRAARRRNVTVHVFEEGYLRPYWVTYERDGANGNSRLMTKTVTEMRAELSAVDTELPPAPARWGDMRQHMFYGALYHYFVLARNGRYRHFRPHREISVRAEFGLYLRRILLAPLVIAERFAATRRVRLGGFPYHLVLLQLEHDSSFRAHSPFSSMTEFIDLVIDGFARGAPPHHHLVFKAHPLEDGRAPIRRTIRAAAERAGLRDRVHFIRGGKLASLLGAARSVVTVNSTAAQQALWRGLPVRAFGAAVYAKPEFVSTQPIDAFFAEPERPDTRAYRDFRRYLLETSQIPGGFYSARGRRQLLRTVVDMMLAAEDPYEAFAIGRAPARQQLHIVH